MIFAADDQQFETPRPTPLFSAVAGCSAANLWTTVEGWSVARAFTTVEAEYHHAKTGAAIADMGAINRYSVRGKDAADFLSRLSTVPATQLQVGQSARGLVLDESGAVIDLVEVSALSGELFLMATCLPHGRRVRLAAREFDVEVDNIGDQIGALGIIGPNATRAANEVGIDLSEDNAASSGKVRGVETAARITQFSALPGVELVFPKEEALTIWERLMRVDGVVACGLDALEILRIEAGVPRPQLDFQSALSADGRDNTRTPDELGLAHLAPLDGGWFNGQRALRARSHKPKRALVCVQIESEAVAKGARVYADGRPTGKVTSLAYSPDLRRNIGFADIDINEGNKALCVQIESGQQSGATVPAELLETPEGMQAYAHRNQQ